jgi:arginyl-tRNA synthetase
VQSLISYLEDKIQSALEKTFKDFVKADVAICMQENRGHYQCNNALKLARILKKNPIKIAEEIVANLDFNTDAGGLLIKEVNIANPGFINITLDNNFLSSRLQKLFNEESFGIKPALINKKVIVEYSSPNIAKELHVGHLRSTIIGESIARLFEFLGYEVLRLNHIGDWGTQFGMLIAYLREYKLDILEGKEQAELADLMHWYKEAKKNFDEDSIFKKKAQLEVIKLQRGDSKTLGAWRAICDISRKAFNEIYDLLGVSLVERGESFYNPMLHDLVKVLEDENLVEISEGAKCIYPPGFKNRENLPLPLMIQKSDGGFNYDTTDLAALKHRIEVEKASRIIIVVDLGQSLHFQLVFAAAKMAGFYDPKKVQVEHVGFGLVLGPDGKKFKTRSGTTEKLIDLLHGAIAHAKKIIEEKLPNASDDEKNKLAYSIGINAVKYADLSCLRTKDYAFSYDKMLRFEGNTAVFLMYSYVRIMGIKRKSNIDISEIIDKSSIDLKHSSETALGFHLLRFHEVLLLVKRDLFLNKLADYLYELAEKFNAFFRDCHVIGSDKENQRLLLCDIAGKILKSGLNILGIETVEKM